MPVPGHTPPSLPGPFTVQPVKSECGSGIAAKVIRSSWSYSAVQAGPQTMPDGEVLRVPPPAPLFSAVSVKAGAVGPYSKTSEPSVLPEVT